MELESVKTLNPTLTKYKTRCLLEDVVSQKLNIVLLIYYTSDFLVPCLWFIWYQ